MRHAVSQNERRQVRCSAVYVFLKSFRKAILDLCSEQYKPAMFHIRPSDAERHSWLQHILRS